MRPLTNIQLSAVFYWERRNNPWAEYAEEFRAEARKYRDLRNELGRAFKPLQDEAYESYCAWEAEENKCSQK